MNPKLKYLSLLAAVCILTAYGIEQRGCSKEWTKSKNKIGNMVITEDSILKVLDHSIDGNYNDFIDLGHGYFELANSRLHLFRNEGQWAMVFEKFGYNVRASQPVQLQVIFFGNCLENLREYNGQTSNMDFIDVENNIFDILQDKGSEITIRGKKVSIPLDLGSYKKYGIEWDFEGKLYEGAILKFLAETSPELTRASDTEIRRCLPKDLKEILTLDNWYQEEYHQFEPTVPPSKQETFRMIAKVLATGDTNYYKPVKKPNTHWSNWPDSGGL